VATKSSTPVRKAGRSLAWLGAIIALLAGLVGAGVMWWGWSLAPKLALDLEGGTQIILAPLVAEGQQVSNEQLEQAVAIIRQRVDATGVAEAEITTLGSNVVVSLPGDPDQATLDRIQASAKLEFRVVLTGTDASDIVADDGEEGDGDTEGEGAEEEPAAEETPDPSGTPTADPTPSGTPTDGSDTAWLTDELVEEFYAFDCATLATAQTNVAPLDEPLITCDDALTTKFILGPVEYLTDSSGEPVLDSRGDRQYLEGVRITDAYAGVKQTSQGISTGEWAVYITFDEAGTQVFGDVTQRLVGYTGVRNMFAIVLDGKVISAPTTNSAITNGKPEISGGFTQASAKTLADQLKFGALPISFTVQSNEKIDATLGASQLEAGILAGLIGLILVVVYSVFQYRALASVTIASLVAAGLITYLVLVILGSHYNYRLSLAGVAGLIIAIGMTVDSFIVYFERVRDELRDGRSLVGSVEAGWKRALRTIYAAKGVNLLSAIVLYIFAVGNVRGFAFTLGVTVLIDVLVVVLFTHPMLQLLAQTRFFSSGHPLSGLDPEALGAVYRGRAEFRVSKEARRAGASREAARRQTIAERKAAEAASESKGKN